MPLHFNLPYRFRAVHSDLYLSDNNGNIIQTDAHDQRWILHHSFDGHGFFITPIHNERVCIASNGRENQLTLAPVAEQDSCKWQYFEITHQNRLVVSFLLNELVDGKTMCADVKGASKVSGAPLILFPVRWMDLQRDNQLWLPQLDATA